MIYASLLSKKLAMKNVSISFFMLGLIFLSCASQNNKLGNPSSNQSQVSNNTSEGKLQKFITIGYVEYSDFGAVGDGVTDDSDAVFNTHAYANQHDLKVKANSGASYYLGGKERTAIIQTDTDFGTAKFIIDDTNLENIKAPIFKVSSRLATYELESISSLRRNQGKIDIELSGTSLVTVTNSNVMHYIRYGLNQNNGAPQTDIFVVDKDGNVDMDSPIIWDFEEITDVKVIPIDQTILNITGGIFTTIANQAESKYNYHHRNISIQRSNVTVDGLEHRITGEGDHGAPYNGFISIKDCAYITIQNTVLTGHKTYRTIGRAGKPVSMGSYDLSVSRALNVSIVNCKQTNDINDRVYWGIIGSNYCKNLIYDGCTFSRFDAHKGVANATVRNTTLGHVGINAIGSGTFTVENSTIRGRSFINLRSDYGSTWQGNMVIRDCVFIPFNGAPTTANLINGSNSGQHDFGYTCYMPERIIIEDLHIDDSNHPDDYKGPAIFKDFNAKQIDESYVEQFPYIKTKEVILKNVTTASGMPLRLSDNEYMFKDVKVIREDADFADQVATVLRDTVLIQAKENLLKAPITVTANSSTRSTGGIHDYFSEGDYWWPDPENSDGPYIRKDGMTNPDNFNDHRGALIRFSEIVGNLTSAYLLTKDSKYADVALAHCRAWFIDDALMMNPNMLYAQAIKGRHTGRGIGIIDGIHFMEVVQSLIVLERAGMVTNDDMKVFRNWFSDFSKWLTTHQYGLDEMVHPNNHGTCWNMQVGLYAVFSRNQEILEMCRERYKNTILPDQMAVDGSFPRELKRTKPYGYALFNLDAMVMNCLILSDESNNLWEYITSDGKSIKQGLEFMNPYVEDKSKWKLDPDVMYWENWPVAHPSFLFGAVQFNRSDYFDLWAVNTHFPEVFEVRRNLPIRNPLIWLNNLK